MGAADSLPNLDHREDKADRGEGRFERSTGHCCMDRAKAELPSSQQIYAAIFRRRTESGRPASSMRLRIATPTAVPRQNYDRLSNQVHKPGIQFGSFTCKTGLMLRP